MNPTSEILDQTPPWNPDAEKWVVGSVLLQQAVSDDLAFLEAGDFHDRTLSQIFAWVRDRDRRNEPIDVGLLKQHFTTDDWRARIAEIVQSVPTAAHACHYGRIVATLAKFRRIREIAVDALQAAHKAEGEPADLLDRVEADLAGIRMTADEDEPVRLGEAAVDASLKIDSILERGRSAGVPTGLLALDRDQGGLFPGELTVLAARPGCGKTSLAMQIAHHNASRGRLVYFASLEMSPPELSIRLACGHSGVSNRLVRTGRLEPSDTRKLTEALQTQTAATLDIHKAARMTIASIRRQIRKRMKYGLTLAVVDYLQLIEPDDRKVHREQQVAQMVRGLKQIATEFNVPVLCCCQLNRQVDENETPRLNHLRESGSIEQDADCVWFLNRHKPMGTEQHNAVLTVAKNRNGEVGPLRLHWDGPTTSFACPSAQQEAF